VAHLVVAADGSGDFVSIAAAVEAAADGDVVSVQPGAYTESVVINKDITLTGAGPREEIVISAPSDGPVHSITEGPVQPYALALMGSNAKISGLTLTGKRSSLLVDGGEPLLRDLHFLTVTEPHPGSGKSDLNAVAIAGGSAATLADSLFEDGGPIGVYDSDPVITGNTFRGGPNIWGSFGDLAVISDNVIDGAATRAIRVQRSGPMLIEGNVITSLRDGGIEAGLKGNSDARIRNNRILGASTGISVREGDQAEVSGNELIDNGIGIRLSRSDGQVVGNEITGGDAGIVVVSGGAPEIADNVIDVTGRGIVAGSRTNPVISGNEVCGDDDDIRVADDASPQLMGNLTCEGLLR